MISQRGRQLAARVAEAMGTPVSYLDPVTHTESLIPPPPRRIGRRRPGRSTSPVEWLLGPRPDRPREPTPWLTGLVVAGATAVVVVVGMLALATTLIAETTDWLAALAVLVVTAGLSPSVWLARRLLVLRWIALGTATGVAVAWLAVLVLILG